MARVSGTTIPLSVPNIGADEEALLRQCVATNFVSSVGPFVERFEAEFAAFTGARYAVACSSGTAALHVAMRLCDVGPGDEVWVSDLTFIASVNPVVFERGTPVLVDSEEVGWNLDPALAVAELDRRAAAGERMPKAIEAVHILGRPAFLAPLVDACARHGVVLIEDAAEALGARYVEGPLAGRAVGTVGRMGCFSFNGNKIMTTGGGGMIVTDDPSLARRAKHLTTQARVPGMEYRHDEVGYNYRLTNLAAALGVAQLARLPDFLGRKREIADRYDAGLRDVPGVTVPARPDGVEASHWLYSIRVDAARFGMDRTRLLERLKDQAIETRPVWTPLHRMVMYAAAPRVGDGTRADRIFETALSLPCSTSLTAGDQEAVIEAVREAAGLS